MGTQLIGIGVTQCQYFDAFPKYCTAGHGVFIKPCLAAGHIDIAFFYFAKSNFKQAQLIL